MRAAVTYLANSELLPLMVLPAAKTKKPRRLAEASGVYNAGCAGAIVGLEHAMSLGFEVTLVA